MSDEPIECTESECVGVVSIRQLLRDLVLIKKYAMDKNDEPIYLGELRLNFFIKWKCSEKELLEKCRACENYLNLWKF